MQAARVVLVELNETNKRLLELAASEAGLPNLKKLVGMSSIATSTADVYDSDYLEPWVQWVSIHTGKPASVHKIKHLGDVKALEEKQIWELLSEKGITSGIWGVMNGERRQADKCRFFLADPWTFEAPVYPSELSGMSDFAVYIAKNYLNLNPLRMLCYAVGYLQALLTWVGVRELFVATGILLSGVMQFGPKNMVLGAFYEYTSAVAFVRARRKFDVQFAVLFLNLIAHLQHHYWLKPQSVSPQLRYGFGVIDRILGLVMQSLAEGEVLLVANGLSQNNSVDDTPWVLYRPVDPAAMLKAFAVNFERVEALMTHDAHVFFGDDTARDQGARILEDATVGGKGLFLAERDSVDKRKLFYRLVFTDAVTAGDTITVNARELPFADVFKEVVTRTGKHCQDGFVYQSTPIVSGDCFNHELCHFICRHFLLEAVQAVALEPAAAKDELACR